MRKWRAVLCGALLWVIIYFEVTILLFGARVVDANHHPIHFMVLAIFTIIVSMIYFNRNVQPNYSEGIKAGIIFIVVIFLLDALFTAPLLLQDYSLLFNSFLIYEYLEIIFLTALMGWSINKLTPPPTRGRGRFTDTLHGVDNF